MRTIVQEPENGSQPGGSGQTRSIPRFMRLTNINAPSALSKPTKTPQLNCRQYAFDRKLNASDIGPLPEKLRDETYHQSWPRGDEYASLSVILKLLDDVFRQMFLDLSMAWNRLGDPGLRIAIPIMFRSVSDQDAAKALDCPDQVNWVYSEWVDAPRWLGRRPARASTHFEHTQVNSLHATTNSSTFRIPGMKLPVMSRHKSIRCSLRSSRVSP